MKSQKKTKKRLNIGYFISILVGAFIGVIITENASFETLGDLVHVIVLFAFFFAAYYIQVILHEGGHLVCGLLSGYRFFMFKIGSSVLLHDEGKWKIKRLHIPGMLGQCLMIPPGEMNDDFPVMLYNLGGLIANVLSAAISLALWMLLGKESMAAMFFMVMACLGLLFALTNGIPVRMSGIDNDGCNARTLNKNPATKRDLWIQLKISEQTAKGVRLRDMPEEWFVMPTDDAMNNLLTLAVATAVTSRMLDRGDLDAAYRQMEHILELNDADATFYHRMLVVDCIYCELMGENRCEKLETLYDKTQKNFMKGMQNFISVARTDYAYALLNEKDDSQIEKCRLRFEKSASTHPYPGDLESERELVELAQKRADEMKSNE